MTSQNGARLRVLLLLSAAALALVACQNTSGGPSSALSLQTKQSPTDAVTHIARAAQKCWFQSKDPAFSGFRLAAEVNSYAGRPRFLLVPRKNPGGLPELVVQAEKRGDSASGSYTGVETYGPLLSGPHGKRITGDVERWANGSSDCAASA
jgi:hypothetical protein